MKFRKLLAFVLVFSMATQPGGVRFGYAEDTKAAEVENKAEESDELAIDLDEAELDEYLFDPGSREQNLEETASVAAEEAAEKRTFSGAIVAAKAAGVAAVFAVVGTLGRMIYNAASNKDAVAEVWTSDEGTFFSRIGKTISILFKGAKALGLGDNNQEIKHPSEVQVELSEVENDPNVENKQEVQENGDVAQQQVEEAEELDLNKEKDEHKGDLQDELDTLKTSIQRATSVDEIEGVEGQLTTLEGKVAEAEAAQNEAERLAKEEAKRKAKEEAERLAKEERKTKMISNSQKRNNWVYELVQNKTKLKRQVDSVQLQINALKEEDRGELQEELNKIKGVIEKATSIKGLEGLEGLEGQLTTLAGEVEKAKAAQQKEMQNQLETIESQDEKKVDSKENNNVQQDNNEESNSCEKNMSILVEEKKEPFTHTFNAQPYYRYEKKHVQKKIGEIKNTCGLNTTNLQNQLNSINLKNVATIDELRAAEESIIKFGEKITSLLNSCKTINSNKGYIENNIQAVVDILDVSDVSLVYDWDEIKNKPVTEGNVGELAKGYMTIAGRVKAILDNNKAISTSTGKISTAIEENEDLEWFDEAYYNGQLDEISNKAKTEESLPGIKSELDELLAELNTNYSSKAIKAVTEVLSKINGSKAIKYFESKECSDDDKDDLYAPYEAIIKPLIAKRNDLLAEAKKNHSLAGVAEKLETLVDRERSIVQNIRALNRNTNAINATLERYKDEAYFDKSYFDEWLTGATKGEIATEDDLALRANNVAAFLAGFNTNYSRKDLSKLSSLDKEINELIPEFDNYQLGYKTQYENDYKAKCAELKKEHDASKIIKELEAYKQNVGARLNICKNVCKDRPELCGK